VIVRTTGENMNIDGDSDLHVVLERIALHYMRAKSAIAIALLCGKERTFTGEHLEPAVRILAEWGKLTGK
jgi:hypothetical protein